MTTNQRRRALGAVLLIAVVAPFVVFWVADRHGLQTRLEAIRAAGMPASPVELDRWYQPVAADSNRALVLMEAANLYVSAPRQGAEGKLKRLETGASLSAAEIEFGQKFLTNNESALALLYRCAEFPESRYPIDFSKGPNTLLPHLGPLKSLVDLLRADAMLRAREGDLDGAVRALRAGFAVADSLRNEPILVSAIVRQQILGQCVEGLSQLLNEHELTDEQLASLAESLAGAEASGREELFRALVGERACNVAVFEMTFGEIDRLGVTPVVSMNDVAARIAFHIYRALGIRERDLLLYLQAMDELVAAAKLDFPDSLREFERAEARISDRLGHGLGKFSVISRNLLVPGQMGGLRVANSAATLRCAEVAVAIERFRLAHAGSLPESVKELAPMYLKNVPADPYNGSLLGVERGSDKGYRVFAEGAVAANRTYISVNATNFSFVVRR